MSTINNYLKYNINKLLDDNTIVSYPIIYTKNMIDEQELPLAFIEPPSSYNNMYGVSQPIVSPYGISQPIVSPYGIPQIKSYETPFMAVEQSAYDPYVKNVIIGTYPNLNNNESIIKSVVKYYYLKIVDKWIYENLKSLLNYIKIVDGKAKLISSIDKYDEHAIDHDSMDDIEKKIIYMEDIIMNKKMVKHVLKELIDNNPEIYWYKLKNYEDKIKHVFYKYMKNKFINAIENK